MQVGWVVRCGAETESGPVSVCWCEGGRLRPWRGHSTGLFPSCPCQRRVWRSNTNFTRKFAILNSTTWLLHVETRRRLATVITWKRANTCAVCASTKTQAPQLLKYFTITTTSQLSHKHYNFIIISQAPQLLKYLRRLEIVLACGNRLRSNVRVKENKT